MKRKLAVVITLSIVSVLSLLAQKKEDTRLDDSANVLQQTLNEDNGLPKAVLDRADCVAVFPSVKKVAVGIGGSYGRGALVCRQGANMRGQWGAPAMYKLDQGSVGLQVGSTATDFVMVIMNQKGAEEILNGKTKLGSNAEAAAGPTSAQATSYNAAAKKADILTYSRKKGLFAGVSLAGASIDADSDANKKLYGQQMPPKEIVTSASVPAAAKPLVEVLDNTSPVRR